MQDAFTIVASDRGLAERFDAVAVFDGVGGLPHGAAAARAAASALPDGLRGAREDALQRAFLHMQGRVLATRGATTGVVAVLPRTHEDVEVGWSGDSGAYLVGKQLVHLTPPDAHDGVLTHCLGLEGMQPNVTQVSVAPGEAVFLCSDGIDALLGARTVQSILSMPGTDAHRLDLLFVAVAAAGAPDNATGVLARRR